LNCTCTASQRPWRAVRPRHGRSGGQLAVHAQARAARATVSPGPEMLAAACDRSGQLSRPPQRRAAAPRMPPAGGDLTAQMWRVRRNWAARPRRRAAGRAASPVTDSMTSGADTRTYREELTFFAGHAAASVPAYATGACPYVVASAAEPDSGTPLYARRRSRRRAGAASRTGVPRPRQGPQMFPSATRGRVRSAPRSCAPNRADIFPPNLQGRCSRRAPRPARVWRRLWPPHPASCWTIINGQRHAPSDHHGHDGHHSPAG
jgi:hypothetical protein